jgi:hypothetical protein
MPVIFKCDQCGKEETATYYPYEGHYAETINAWDTLIIGEKKHNLAFCNGSLWKKKSCINEFLAAKGYKWDSKCRKIVKMEKKE